MQDMESATAGRSRKGAWIEIQKFATLPTLSDGRSRKGAWIEIYRDLTGKSLEFASLP